MLQITALTIQMFAKTFDTVQENSMQEYLFRFAQLTIEWRQAPKFPPPFNVVVDLLMVVKWFLSKLRRPCVDWQPKQIDSKPGPFELDSFLKVKHVTRTEWIKEVHEDFMEHSESGSDSQMEKFKSTMLKRSKKLELKLQSLEAKMLQQQSVTQGMLHQLLDQRQGMVQKLLTNF
jgi:hypothetical protein